MSELTHFNSRGEAHMVDVGDKDQTHRVAVCEGQISMKSETLDKILQGDHKKGDVLGIARIAGIMAAKKTADLIPLCHPLRLDTVELGFDVVNDSTIKIQATVGATERTGVEMEALTAVQIALLTIYDMCKAYDRGMTITDIQLVEKSGGKSGHFVRDDSA